MNVCFKKTKEKDFERAFNNYGKTTDWCYWFSGDGKEFGI